MKAEINELAYTLGIFVGPLPPFSFSLSFYERKWNRPDGSESAGEFVGIMMPITMSTTVITDKYCMNKEC